MDPHAASVQWWSCRDPAGSAGLLEMIGAHLVRMLQVFFHRPTMDPRRAGDGAFGIPFTRKLEDIHNGLFFS